MRAGSHPLKKVGKLNPPPEVTVCMVTFIPFLSGYFEQSLDVLRASLGSLWRNTDLLYDLMVFDNGSCPEVQQYLLEQQRAHRIQYLFLSDKNVGLPGAWNALFRAAPGKIIAYSDSDVYFSPGWLQAGLDLILAYPNVGMVTCRPLRSLPQLYTSTMSWADATPGVAMERGCLQDWDRFWIHMRSLGMTEEQARQKFTAEEDIRIEYQGKPAYVGAGHFQYISPREALNAVAPFPYVMPMGNELYLDEKLNELGYLRLETTEMYVRHLGNRLDAPDELARGTQASPVVAKPVKPMAWWKRAFYAGWDIPLVKKLMLRLYNIIFRLYYGRTK